MGNNLVVVIATAGRPRLLRRTLDSLAACEKPAIYRETIVVENGPKGGVENIVRHYVSSLNVRYLYVSLANKSHAVNQALATLDSAPAEGSILIFFTDDDVRFHPDILCAYARAAAGHTSGIFFGGPTGVDYQQEPPGWLLYYLPNSARGWEYESGKPITGQELFLGFNWAAFLADVRKIGGFDTNRGPGAITGSRGMETAAQIRLLNHGLRGEYRPEAWVWHYVPKERCSPAWVLKRAYQTGIHAGMNATHPGTLSDKASTPNPVRKWGSIGWTLVRELAQGRPHALFGLVMKFWRLCGYVKGKRIAHKTLLRRK